MRKFLMIILLAGILGQAQQGYSATDAKAALEKLMAGNQRFASGQSLHPRRDEKQRWAVVSKQKPFAAVLACADSRVPPEILFDQGIGDLFVIRVAGNTPDDFVYASLEYGVENLKVPLIFVLGHEHCGAVAAALQKKPYPGHLHYLVAAIQSAIQEKTCNKNSILSCAIEKNVAQVMKRIQESQPILAPLFKKGSFQVAGGVYDLETGKVRFLP